MTHMKYLVVLLAGLCSLGAGCFCLQQKDKEVETHEAVAVSHNAEATTADSTASEATGTEEGAATALSTSSPKRTPSKSAVVSGVKDVPTFLANYNSLLTSDDLQKALMFSCSVSEVSNCHQKVAGRLMIGMISCGDETTVSESHPPSFWQLEKYCSHEVKKGKACPTDKVKLLSGVDGLASLFLGPVGILVYDPADDGPKRARTTYFYCRQGNGREMAVRLDFNGGKAAAYRPSGALLGASLLAVFATTIVGGFW